MIIYHGQAGQLISGLYNCQPMTSTYSISWTKLNLVIQNVPYGQL